MIHQNVYEMLIFAGLLMGRKWQQIMVEKYSNMPTHFSTP